MPTPRQHWLRTANQLRHLLDSERARVVLTQDEIDWAALLRDRLYDVANHGPGRCGAWTELLMTVDTLHCELGAGHPLPHRNGPTTWQPRR